MLAHWTQELRVVWRDLPEPDKGIVTAAALLFGLLLLVVLPAMVLAAG